MNDGTYRGQIPCPGCRRVVRRPVKDGLCRSCSEALADGLQLREQKQRTEDYVLLVRPERVRAQGTKGSDKRILNLLIERFSAGVPAGVSTSGYVEAPRASCFTIMTGSHPALTRADAELVAAVTAELHQTCVDCYNDGLRTGSSLLRMLHNGDISASEFDRRVDTNREKHNA